jgi:hypothetical protein
LFRLVDSEGVINRMGFNNDGSEALAARLAGVRRPGVPTGRQHREVQADPAPGRRGGLRDVAAAALPVRRLLRGEREFAEHARAPLPAGRGPVAGAARRPPGRSPNPRRRRPGPQRSRPQRSRPQRSRAQRRSGRSEAGAGEGGTGPDPPGARRVVDRVPRRGRCRCHRDQHHLDARRPRAGRRRPRCGDGRAVRASARRDGRRTVAHIHAETGEHCRSSGSAASSTRTTPRDCWTPAQAWCSSTPA